MRRSHKNRKKNIGLLPGTKKTPKNHIRKPPNTLPLVGNGLHFLQDRHKLLAWFVRCERLFGRETFKLYVPSLPPGVVINDPQNLDFVFKNERIFAKGDFMKKPLWDLFGPSVRSSSTAM